MKGRKAERKEGRRKRRWEERRIERRKNLNLGWASRQRPLAQSRHD